MDSKPFTMSPKPNSVTALSTDHSKFIEKLDTQIGMLTDIKETYEQKINQLKQMSQDGAQEHASQ